MRYRGAMQGPLPLRETADAFADRRAYERTELALPAFLQANGERHPVHLVDVSVGGGKLNCAVDLPVGSSIVLDCGTLGRPAVVRWQNAGAVGICFDRPLEAREVSALIDRSHAVAAWVKTRP